MALNDTHFKDWLKPAAKCKGIYVNHYHCLMACFKKRVQVKRTNRAPSAFPNSIALRPHALQASTQL